MSEQHIIAIEPTRDWRWMDSVLERPEIRDRISYDGCEVAGSLEIMAGNPRNYFLKVVQDARAAGFFMLVWKSPGVYEVHTNLLPECHGREAIEAGKLGRDFMFLHTDCHRLTSYCPGWLPESLLYAQTCGFRPEWKRDNFWQRNGEEHNVTFVSITLWEWVRTAHAGFETLGRQFHTAVFEQLEETSHPDDHNHDAMVGLTMRMAAAGQPYKAELIYNEWAAIAGYAPIRLLGERDGELAVDIVTAVIGLSRNMNARVIRKAAKLCQQQQQ